MSLVFLISSSAPSSVCAWMSNSLSPLARLQNDATEDDSATASCSARSSITFTNPEEPCPHRPSPLQSSTPEIAQLTESVLTYTSDDEVPRAKLADVVSPLDSTVGSRDPNLVHWDGPDDPQNPQNWSKGFKWMITAVCMLLSLNVCVCILHFFDRHLLVHRTFASSAPAALSLKVAAHFEVSDIVSSLITSVFLIGYCFGVSSLGIVLWAVDSCPSFTASCLGPRKRGVRSQIRLYGVDVFLHSLHPRSSSRHEHGNTASNKISLRILWMCAVDKRGRRDCGYLGSRRSRSCYQPVHCKCVHGPGVGTNRLRLVRSCHRHLSGRLTDFLN